MIYYCNWDYNYGTDEDYLSYMLNHSALLVWYFEDSSHGDGLMEGLDGVQRRVGLEIG
jgi:hypothetical protein